MVIVGATAVVVVGIWLAIEAAPIAPDSCEANSEGEGRVGTETELTGCVVVGAGAGTGWLKMSATEMVGGSKEGMVAGVTDWTVGTGVGAIVPAAGAVGAVGASNPLLCRTPSIVLLVLWAV